MPTLKAACAAVQKFKAAAGRRVEYFGTALPGFGLRVAGPTPRAPEGAKIGFCVTGTVASRSG